ncbi:hypothetical protein ESZ53_10690 [Salinibacterium sp. UTAS2018]|uniref:hypothetical protein n=1 Tax=Salinibacterium sp. UTAS2018 TaxID=2508880 RepID=UPI0010094A76|nr:hypothetical protein [Salinibacterium sp. UTAS2018]QAV70867.1 hypothetical protein ESZ53_10690 [Salinibacterium sp. UTAS2018]
MSALHTTSTTDASSNGWREIAPELTQIAEWSHSGAAVLADGRIVVSTPGSAHVSVITPDGSVTTLPCGAGIYHGMATDPGASSSAVWLADIGVEADGGGLFLFDVDAKELTDVGPDDRTTAHVVGWRPTALAVERGITDPAGSVLWVADGYGHSLVHRLEDGRITLTIDGSASGQAFDCPHGIALEDRGDETLVVVADRSNERLVWFDLTGAYVRELRSPLITSPSSITVYDNRLIVTELFGGLIAVASDDTVTDLLNRSPRERVGAWPNEGDSDNLLRPAVIPGQINSPHGIATTKDGVVLTEWIIGGRTILLGHDIVGTP